MDGTPTASSRPNSAVKTSLMSRWYPWSYLTTMTAVIVCFDFNSSFDLIWLYGLCYTYSIRSDYSLRLGQWVRSNGSTTKEPSRTGWMSKRARERIFETGLTGRVGCRGWILCWELSEKLVVEKRAVLRLIVDAARKVDAGFAGIT